MCILLRLAFQLVAPCWQWCPQALSAVFLRYGDFILTQAGFLLLLPRVLRLQGCVHRVTHAQQYKTFSWDLCLDLTSKHICFDFVSLYFMTLLFYLSFETGSNITQAGLKLGSCLYPPGASMTGVLHSAWLLQVSLSQIINIEISLPLQMSSFHCCFSFFVCLPQGNMIINHMRLYSFIFSNVVCVLTYSNEQNSCPHKVLAEWQLSFCIRVQMRILYRK